jgi:hypothetical protein
MSGAILLPPMRFRDVSSDNSVFTLTSSVAVVETRIQPYCTFSLSQEEKYVTLHLSYLISSIFVSDDLEYPCEGDTVAPSPDVANCHNVVTLRCRRK